MPSYHMISRGSHHFDFVTAVRKYLAGAGAYINMPWRVLGNDEIDGTLEGVSKVGKRSVRANFSLHYGNGAWPNGVKPAGAEARPPAEEPHVIVCMYNNTNAIGGVHWLSMTDDEFRTFITPTNSSTRKAYIKNMK